eukprot:6642576-Prorocentrum_lima.AAC.1
MGMERHMVDHTSQETTTKDLPSNELSALELEDFKAMICHEHPGGGKKGEKYLFKNYNHRKGSPKHIVFGGQDPRGS